MVVLFPYSYEACQPTSGSAWGEMFRIIIFDFQVKNGLDSACRYNLNLHHRFYQAKWETSFNFFWRVRLGTFLGNGLVECL